MPESKTYMKLLETLKTGNHNFPPDLSETLKFIQQSISEGTADFIEKMIDFQPGPVSSTKEVSLSSYPSVKNTIYPSAKKKWELTVPFTKVKDLGLSTVQLTANEVPQSILFKFKNIVVSKTEYEKIKKETSTPFLSEKFLLEDNPKMPFSIEFPQSIWVDASNLKIGDFLEINSSDGISTSVEKYFVQEIVKGKALLSQDKDKKVSVKGADALHHFHISVYDLEKIVKSQYIQWDLFEKRMREEGTTLRKTDKDTYEATIQRANMILGECKLLMDSEFFDKSNPLEISLHDLFLLMFLYSNCSSPSKVLMKLSFKAVKVVLSDKKRVLAIIHPKIII